MNRTKIALSFLVAAGLSAAVPSAGRAQYGRPGAPGVGPNSTLAPAKQQVKDAEAEVARIRGQMNKIKAKVQAKYEGKEEWETAQKNLKAAERANEEARKKALAKLSANAEYKVLKDKQIKAEQTIAAQQAAGKNDSKELQKAQQDRIDAGMALRRMENDALQGDESVSAAKEKLAEAKKAWDALQDELKEALSQDPEYAQAEQELQTAQAAVQTAKDSLQQQAMAERQARRQQQEAERAARSRGTGRPGGYGGGYGGGYR